MYLLIIKDGVFIFRQNVINVNFDNQTLDTDGEVFENIETYVLTDVDLEPFLI